MPSERITNSSPPTRATVSVSRTTVRSLRAIERSTTFPASWPHASFTALKPSRSTTISAKDSPVRRDRASACSIRSSRSFRFGRPVSGSRRAARSAVRMRWVKSHAPRAATADIESATVTAARILP